MTNDFQNPQLPAEDNKQNPVVFSTLPPLTIAFIALFGIFFLYQVGGAILTLLIFGLNFEKADVNALRLLTMGGQILLILLPTLIFARAVYHQNTSFVLRMKFPSVKEIGIFVIGLILLLPILQNIMFIQNFLIQKLASSNLIFKKIVDLLDQLDKLVDKTYGDLLTAHSVFEGSFIVFVVAVIPALCEETLFRGLVQKSFEQKLGPLWSIMITALFFGIYHFNPYGLIPLIALGIYFGYAAYVSDSIFVPMSLHFTNNFLSVLVFFLLGDDELVKTPVGHNISIAPHLISFVVFSTLFFSYIFFVKKNYRKFVHN
jgi:membrane protease YdiL (CAAX protease family)